MLNEARRFELSRGETAWPTVGLCAGLAVAQIAAARLLPAPLGVLACCAAAYAQFTVAHDASHRGVSRRRWLNELCGYAAGIALLMPHEAFRRNHLHHHAHTNDPAQDPDFWVAGATLPRTLLRCATILQYHYYCYIFRLGRRDGVWARSWTLLGAFAVAALGAFFLGFGRAALLYWILPAQVATAALGLLFDYWPHRPHTERGRLRDTAAILPRYLDPFFLRQNLHLVHHLFPAIPWYRYREALGALEPELRAASAPMWGMRQALKMLR